MSIMFVNTAMLVMFIIQLSVADALTETKPNVEFLGAGYDVIKGNPHTNYHDPGFRQSVVKIQNDEVASDGSDKLLNPGVQLVLGSGKHWCSYSPVVDTVNDSVSYTNILSRDAVLRGSEFAEQFSDNDLFRDLKIDTSDYGRKYVVSVAKCSIYEAYFNCHKPDTTNNKPNGALVSTEAFASAVADLPVVGGESKYLQFIDTFGTHYVGRVRVGAKAVWLNAFELSTWLALGDAGFNFSAAASASFIASTGGQASLSVVEVQLKHTLEKNASYVRKNYIGRLPPGDGQWESWAKVAEASPQPIEYDVYPLTNLLTNELFPQIAPETLLNISSRLARLFHKTTGTKVSNAAGAVAKTPKTISCLNMLQLTAEYAGVVKLSCPPGHKLLSCGISDTQFNNHELFRHAVPISSSTCDCYDYYGARCHAWCTNAPNFYMYVASSGLTRGVFNVYCPGGYKVYAREN